MAYGQRWVLIEASYPNSEAGIQPRHRFISAFEQKIEAPSKDWQYLVLACDPYDNIAFKIPNKPIDKNEGKFVTHYDRESGLFSLKMHFL